MSVVGSTETVKRDRKKRPDELLASVVRETAVPATVELLRSNARFAFPSGNAWLILMLDSHDIGGLSRRQGRDEAKGSIIELIGADLIHTVATAQMLAEEAFGIIPTDGTLERMNEFSLLTSAPYAWAVAWLRDTGDLVIDLVGDATFAQARYVASGHLTLAQVVGAEVWDEHRGDEALSHDPAPSAGAPAEHLGFHPYLQLGDEPPAAARAVSEVPGESGPAPAAGTASAGEDWEDEVEADDAVDDDASLRDGEERSVEAADGVEGEDEEEGAGTEPEAAAADAPAPPSTPGDTPAEQPQDGDEAALEQVPEPAAQEAYAETHEEVRDAIARRFLSEELGLDIRLDEFETTFAIGAPVVRAEVPQGATEWLADQVAQLTRQANAELAQLRAAHEDQLRTLYVDLMSTHAEQVLRDVATDREGSRYKALKDGIDRVHAEQLADKERTITARRAQLQADFERSAAQAGELARLQAEVQYKERNRTRLERDQADVAVEIQRLVENDRSLALQRVLKLRSTDAALKMQIGQTRVFEVVAERRDEHLAAEQELLARWRSEIGRFVDDNRKADISRADALHEYHSRVDAVGSLQRQQAEQLEAMTSEHADRIRRMEQELERQRQEAITAQAARDEEWRHQIDLEKEKTDSQTQRVSDLLDQMDHMGESFRSQYDQRLLELEADKQTYREQMQIASAIQSRSNRTLTVLVVSLGLLMGAAGVIVGSAFF